MDYGMDMDLEPKPKAKSNGNPEQRKLPSVCFIHKWIVHTGRAWITTYNEYEYQSVRVCAKCGSTQQRMGESAWTDITYAQYLELKEKIRKVDMQFEISERAKEKEFNDGRETALRDLHNQ